jgi:membrane protein implicated in regulation of membrane protease activity
MTDTGLVGEVAYVTVATKGANGPGEIQLNGDRLIAWSHLPVARGQSVMITAVRDIRTVSVDPIDL